MVFGILDLPGELRFEVLKFLDAREIQSVRRVSKVLCGFVDQNEEVITRRRRRLEIARLEGFVSHYNSFEDIPFLQALDRWTHHRGAWRDPRSQMDSLRLFAIHLHSSRGASHDFVCFNCWMLARYLVSAHISLHRDHRRNTMPPGDFWDVVRTPGQMCFTEQVVRETYEAVVRDDSVLHGALHPKSETLTSSVPSERLTAIRLTSRQVLLTDEDWINPWLTEMLDIPELPTSNIFGYFVRTQAGLRLVRNVLSERLRQTPFIILAILEELYVY